MQPAYILMKFGTEAELVTIEIFITNTYGKHFQLNFYKKSNKFDGILQVSPEPEVTKTDIRSILSLPISGFR